MGVDNADPGATEFTFPNILAVVEHLKAGGWKVAKSMAYQHRNDGKLRPREDGLFHNKDVVKYARSFLRRMDTGKTVSADIDALQQERARAETDKMIAQAEHWQIRTAISRGRYVEKELFERELARRASVFKNDIDGFVRAQASGIIDLVAGDVAKTPDLIEFMLGQAEDWLDRYAEEREFKVPLLPADTTDERSEDEDDD